MSLPPINSIVDCAIRKLSFGKIASSSVEQNENDAWYIWPPVVKVGELAMSFICSLNHETSTLVHENTRVFFNVWDPYGLSVEQ